MYDAVIIGAGSGGLAAAKAAKKYQANVAIIEKGPVGGTCVNVGCVPKKLMVVAAQMAESFEQSGGYGWDIQKQFKWESLIAKQQSVVNMLSENHRKKLESLEIPVYEGHAEFIDPFTVQVGNQTLQAKQFLIATGAKAKALTCEGAEYCDSSDDFFQYPKLPKRIVIVGAGYIACELASLLSLLGSEVHLIIRSSLLRDFDESVQSFMTESLSKRIHLHTPCTVEKITKTDQNYLCHLSNQEKIECSHILNATGRTPNFTGLRLKHIGLDLHNLAIDHSFKSKLDHISIIGDLVNSQQLTPLAIAQGRWWAEALFSKTKPKPFETTWIPTAVFTVPEYACVGFTEKKALERYGTEIKIYQQSFTPLTHLMLDAEKRQKVFMKMICMGEEEKIIGLHFVGPSAAEMMQSLAIGLECGVTKKDFDNTIALHPCLAEEWVTWY